MDVITSYRVSNKEMLPLLTGFLLVVDGIALFILGMKSEGWDRLTGGDIVTISVLVTFTLLLLLADLWHILRTKNLKRRQVLYGRLTTNNFAVCSICLEKMNYDDAQLQCGHAFHTQCIDRWINRNQFTCPLCRTQLVYMETSRFHFNIYTFIRSLSEGKEKSAGFVSVV